MAVFLSTQARAEEAAVGMATPWQLNFQAAASPVMERLDSTHTMLLWIIFTVSIVVLLGTLYIIVKFNRKANPVPSTTTHNTMLEIVWTVIPIIILVAIAIPSVRSHYYIEKEPEEGITLKVTGHQWYWNYAYPDHGGFEFDSYMLSEEEAKNNQEPRLLAVDNRVVVPVNTPVRVLMTSADVIHAWAVPAFAVKRDAVPGRLNESWFEATREGVFYGQCSELCGVKHGFMPVAVEVVSQEKFDVWVMEQQKAAGIEPVATPATVEGAAAAVPAEASAVSDAIVREVTPETVEDSASIPQEAPEEATPKEAPEL